MEGWRESLRAATRSKLKEYHDLVSGKLPGRDFFDVVVVTARDEQQQALYQRQLQAKKDRKEIPCGCKYLVFHDPPGVKIGDGGATLNVFEQLEKSLSKEELDTARVVLINAGGYSQRLPHVSALGKVFMPLPCGGGGGEGGEGGGGGGGGVQLEMLDIILASHIDIPHRMKPGIYSTPSDIIFLYNGTGDWSFSEPGFTGVAHPAPLQLGTTHGVYVLEDAGAIWQRYCDECSGPTAMADVKQFVHKVSVEKMKAVGAVIPNTDKVYVDHSFYIERATVRKLLQFYTEHTPLKCELDAYGDFLQPLGPSASPDYCKNTANVMSVSSDFVEMRERVFRLLKGTGFRAVVFNQAQFNHVGTALEYLEHLCCNAVLGGVLGLSREWMVRDSSSGSREDCSREPPRKQAKLDDEEENPANYVLMNCVVDGRESVSIGEGSVVQHCVLEEGVKVGSKCILAHLHLPAHTVVPDGSYLQCVAVEVDGKEKFITYAFDVADKMKACRPLEEASSLPYSGLEMAEAAERLGCGAEGIIWPPQCGACTLWNAKLFPLLGSRMESSLCAVEARATLTLSSQSTAAKEPHVCRGPLYSLEDIMKVKSLKALLDFQAELRK